MTAAEETGTKATDIPELTYPSEDWAGFIKNHLGPSLMWALLGIGASHMVLAPVLGGMFGLFGIWIVAVIYLAKYGGWELGIQYNYATGKNPVEGYGNLPGPDHWGQVFTMLVYLVGWTVILASVGFSAATFLASLVPNVGVVQLYYLLVAITVVLTILSRYSWLENLMKGFVILLAVFIVLGVFVSPPSAQVVAETTFAVPDLTSVAFLGLFAALAGFAPTGLSTTVTIGSWSVAKKEGARALQGADYDFQDEQFREYVASWMRVGKRDFRIAFAFSFLLLVSMILLASAVIYPNPPQDQNLAAVVGSILEAGFGDWTAYLVMVGAFAALYSTVITVMDGAARVNADTLPLILEREMDTERLRRGFIVLMGAASVIPIVTIGQLPLTLIVFAAALMAILQVFFYFANYYIVRTELPEFFQPSRTKLIYYAVSMGLVVVFGIMGAMARLGVIS
ncbi:MAG: Nramp family divalent metal transporter [Halodesulfurarchaeum sp.]